MYTKADLRTLAPRTIFDRGVSYYESGAVGRIKQKDNTYQAKVRGTDTYHAELTMLPKGPPDIYCDCPYDYGNVCKHGIALGLAVLDLVSAAAPTLPAPMPPPSSSSAAPTTQQLQKALLAALTRTSDKDKIAYLGQLLYQRPDLITGFLDAFEFSLPALLAATAAKSKPRPVAKTFVQLGQELLQTGHKPDLLPFLLRYDWRHTTPEEAPQLADLLAAAARLQPEATLEAVMERVETYLAASQRTALIYQRLVSWLTTLVGMPALANDVRLFASELWKQYGRRAELCGALTEAGFAPLPVDVQEEALRKKQAAIKSAAASPKRPGRAPRAKP
ncbi:MAG: hypothetical protein EOO37_00265 [Cytophagaceae bacterium]|nr:MAG: hypothetical protein EOO37_00265 [Cytophagaceae bacterium]